MAAKGITAALVIIAFMLSMSMLSALGVYEEMGISIGSDVDAQTDEINDELQGINAEDTGGGVFAGFTTGPANSLTAMYIAIFETPKLIRTFFPAPEPIPVLIGSFLQTLMGLAVLMFVGSVVL